MESAASVHSFEATEADFEQRVLAESRRRPVVVDFWAPWCGPCRALGPLLERAVAARGGEVALAKVNIDEAQQLAARYRVQSIPAVIAFRDGAPVKEFVGALPERQVQAFLDSLAPTEADRLVRQAREARSADAAAAEALYRRALEVDPRHDAARLGLAETLLDRGTTTGVADLLESVTASGEPGEHARRLQARAWFREKAGARGDVEAARARVAAEPANGQLRYELGTLLGDAGEFPTALTELLAAGEADPKLAAGPVREAMVHVFHLLGDQHPLANEFRARLSRLLF